jgi:hypothetical protein
LSTIVSSIIFDIHTYAGLCNLLAGCNNFEVVIKANEEITNSPQSDANNIDLLVGDVS